jgi:hypothetical protein
VNPWKQRRILVSRDGKRVGEIKKKKEIKFTWEGKGPRIVRTILGERRK